MKEIGKERKIAIAALIVAVLMLTVAFAAMSRTLKINGTAKVDSANWDIRFTSAEMKSKKGDARQVTEPVIDNGGINLTLKVGLRKPKDEITYEAVIENLGDIDAEIESIEYPELNEEQAKIIEFVATYQNGDEISKSQEINAGEEKIVKIVIRYKDITDESLLAKEAYDVPLTFKINYIQKGFNTESTPEGGEIVDTESSPFKVTKDGVLVHYERQGNETSVTVPAEVNGIKIRKISTWAFLDNVDGIVFSEKRYIIGINPDVETFVSSIPVNFIMIDEFLKNPLFEWELNNDKPNEAFFSLDPNSEEGMSRPGENLSNYYLTSVDLSNMIYLEEIGDYAFLGKDGYGEEECGYDGSCSLGVLETVKLPENGMLTTIGTSAFEHNRLKSINIPNSVIEIKDEAFGQNSLENVILSNNLITIGSGAFKKNNLTNLSIPASVTTIDRDAFGDNPLTVVTIEGDSTRFDSVWREVGFSGVTRN